VHISITGIPYGDEETLGGVVVKNADNNQAPRQEITLTSTLSTGTVTLTRSNTKVKVFTAAAGGTEITFNGTDNVFSVSTPIAPLYVEGATESDSMRDVELTLTHALAAPAKAKFTIVWVTLTTKHTGTISDDNSRKTKAANDRFPPSSTLGFALEILGAGYDLDDQNAKAGILSEFIGTVKPADFRPGDFVGSSMYLARETISGKSFEGLPPGDGNETAESTGDDTSSAEWRDDDPQSGGSAGKIYDVDAPALYLLTTQTANWIRRWRLNFQFWAVFILRVTALPTPIRCSEKKSWYHRLSVKLTGATHSGTSTGAGTATTLVTAGLTVDQWKNGAIYIHTGTGKDQVRPISGNTATTITVSGNWDTNPDATSRYWLISSTTWTKLSEITGDNQNGDGSTNTTWNLA
jgi:hypothetical protein